MNNRTKAYNEMVDLLLTPEDREKFEWAIGAMLAEGPPNSVVVRGGKQTGKTTLMLIVRKIIQAVMGPYIPRVALVHDGYVRSFSDDTYVFVEQNEGFTVDEPHILIQTTGDSVPVHKHYVLMETINSEVDDIAEQCIAQYNQLGEDYFEEVQENN